MDAFDERRHEPGQSCLDRFALVFDSRRNGIESNASAGSSESSWCAGTCFTTDVGCVTERRRRTGFPTERLYLL